MLQLKGRTAGFLAAVALLVPVAPAAAVADTPPVATAAHSCSSGYTHAALSWGHRCLRAGQYCKRDKNAEYHRYDFHCKRSTGRLTYY